MTCRTSLGFSIRWLVGFVLSAICLAQTDPEVILEPDPSLEDEEVYYFDTSFESEMDFSFLSDFSSTNDTDEDGMSDDYENFFLLDYTNPADAQLNYDCDLLVNVAEEDLLTDPNEEDTDRDGFLDDCDSNPLSRVYIHWGNPIYSFDNDYTYPGPTWWRAAYKVGGNWITNEICGWQGAPVSNYGGMVWTPEGTNYGTDPDGNAHALVVSNGFFIDQKEVSKWYWQTVRDWAMNNGYGGLPSLSTVRDGHPVQSMTWYEAVKWCNARSEKNGYTPAYYTDSSKTNVYRKGALDLTDDCVEWYGGFRLPSVIEWEYAGRGTEYNKRFPFGANITHGKANYYSTNIWAYDTSGTRGYHPTYKTNGVPYTSPVDFFETYGFNDGLYNMAGNVAEWTWEWHNAGHTKRAVRGGSWNHQANVCTLSYQFGREPTNRLYYLGFRSILAKSKTEKLIIEVDRTILTNDVDIRIEFTNGVNSTLYIGLTDSNHAWVVTNLYGNILNGSSVTTVIPLTSYTNACEIVIWTDDGPVTVHKTSIYIDQDHDGLDSDQENQLGTSDSNSDTDSDGYSDYSEIFTYNTDPTNGDTNKPLVTITFPWDGLKQIIVP